MSTPKKQILNGNRLNSLTVKLEPMTPKDLKKLRSSIKKVKHSEPGTPKANIEFSLELKKAINERNILTSRTRKIVFDALDDIKNKSEAENRCHKRNQALLEIINSEIKYVKQLEIIKKFFMQPVIERKLLKQDDYNVLFGNIETIYNVNKQLLKELDEGFDNVPNAFSKIAPFLKLYSVYAYEFKNSLRLIHTARGANPQFAKFVEMQETRPEVQSTLSSLLITPIQRVPRYKLLLMHLQELTLPSEKDYCLLVECLEKVQDAAEHINKIVEDQENAQKMLEFQRRLYGLEPNIITPGRTLKMEGTLMKMTTKQSHSEKLYVVLMNDIVMFNKMKRDDPKVNSLKCISIFPLNKCKIHEILDKGCFRIECQKEEIILYHDQLSETKKWISKLRVAIQNHIDDRKTLRKESSSRRPVKRKDILEYHEIGVSPGRPLKKRKLELQDHLKGELFNKIRGRQSIRSSSPTVSSITTSVIPEQINESHLASEITGSSPEANNKVGLRKVFVFGDPNNANEGFKFSKIIGGVGNSIKKFLGFK